MDNFTQDFLIAEVRDWGLILAL